MKTYTELTSKQQAKSLEQATNNLLASITEGAICFDGQSNNNDLQARIDSAQEEAEDMQTPWFASEYIMDAAGDEIKGMAQCEIEDALYPELNEHCIQGIAG